jgi:cystathionine beta-synthase
MSVIDHFEQVTDKDGAIAWKTFSERRRNFCYAGSCIQGLMQLKIA